MDEATIRRVIPNILQKAEEEKIAFTTDTWKIAENGNAAMAIFLGKNELGQSDNGTINDDNEPLPFSD